MPQKGNQATQGNEQKKPTTLTPGQQADQYRRAAAVAKRAGAPPELIQPLQDQEKVARQKKEDQKLTAKLQQARQAEQKARQHVAQAATAVEQAQAKLQQAAARLESAV